MGDEPKPSRTRTFGAAVAIGALLANLAVQVVMSFAVVYLIRACYGLGGAQLTKQALSLKLRQDFILPLGLFTILPGTYVTYFIARRFFPGSLRDGVLEPLGWKSCPTRTLWLGAAAGGAIILFVPPLIQYLFPPGAQNAPSPLMHLAVSSSWGLFQVATLGVLVAPICEEFVFRGVLYSGVAKSWGKAAGAVVTTLLFTLAHAPEAKAYLPALIGVACFGAVAVYARERTGSLAASVAVHTGYNFTIFSLVALTQHV